MTKNTKGSSDGLNILLPKPGHHLANILVPAPAFSDIFSALSIAAAVQSQVCSLQVSCQLRQTIIND
jgi:hypothetical protein